jgi:Bacterial conjugation TrbI-like protein
MSTASEDPARGQAFPLRMRILAAGALGLVIAAWMLKDRGGALPPSPAPPSRVPPSAPLPTRLAPEELTQEEAQREAPPAPGAYRREVERPKPVQNVADSGPAREENESEAPPGGPMNRRRDEKKTLPEIFRMPPDAGPVAREAAAPGGPVPPKAVPAAAIADDFAPFGRLLKCELVDTLDSVTARSEPILGIVTQDLDWNGNVIIRAGTEVFSYARPEAVIDAAGVGRLVDTGEWTLVLPGGPDGENGRELILKARAVDRRETLVDARGTAQSWAIDDGADGLIGYTLSTLDDEEIRLFAAAAMSGMAQGMTAVAERQEPAPGVAGALGATQVAPTVANAAEGALGSGAADVMNELAGRIRQEISKRGVYVRVPAGKEFYLFVEQTIDPRAAEVGLRLPGGSRAAR